VAVEVEVLTSLVDNGVLVVLVAVVVELETAQPNLLSQTLVVVVVLV
jgi:hypothetical protein